MRVPAQLRLHPVAVIAAGAAAVLGGGYVFWRVSVSRARDEDERVEEALRRASAAGLSRPARGSR